MCGDWPPLGLIRIEQFRGGIVVDDRGESPPKVVRVLDACVHSLSSGRRVDMRRVAGEEHAAISIASHEPDVGSPDRGPHRLLELDVASAGAALQGALKAREIKFGLLPGRDARDVLKQVGRQQRAQTDKTVCVGPCTPRITIQALNWKVGEQITGMSSRVSPTNAIRPARRTRLCPPSQPTNQCARTVSELSPWTTSAVTASSS